MSHYLRLAIVLGLITAVGPFAVDMYLPARLKAGASLNEPNPTTFYTQGAEGYTDYPTLDRAAAAQ